MKTILIWFLALSYVSSHIMCREVSLLHNTSISGSNRFLSYIPVINLTVADAEHHFHKHTRFTLRIYLLILSSMISFSMYLLNGLTTLTIISLCFTISELITVLFERAILIYEVMYETGVVPKAQCIVMSILYPIGQLYIGLWLSEKLNRSDRYKALCDYYDDKEGVQKLHAETYKETGWKLPYGTREEHKSLFVPHVPRWSRFYEKH